VKKGQLLFRIDPRPFQAEVNRLSAELRRTRSQSALAASNHERGKRLVSQHMISQQDFDQLATTASTTTDEIGAAAAALETARLNLEFTEVRSPIDGRVSRALITAGNLVSNASILTTVVSDDPVYAYFDADEQIYLKYTAGGDKRNRSSIDRRIRMALANEEGFPREGQLDFLDNQLDGATGTIRGRAVFRNTDGRLTPGLFVRLRLAGTGTYHGVLVQDRAVGTDLSKKFVYVVSPKHEIEYRPVTLGPIVNGLRVVRSGLKVGEPVVVNGLQRIRPGAPVTPVVVSMDGDPNSQVDPRYGRNNGDERNQSGGPAQAGHYGTN